MIIWLASYPRSGNTLLRIILKSVFDLSSFSKHDDADDIGSDARIIEHVGHQFLPATWAESYKQFKASNALCFVKTHDEPEDSGKAIYVVRDGRASCRSFYHYLKEFPHLRARFSVRDVVAGFTPFGSWSDHLDKWDPQNRSKTLLLTYENLVADATSQIERISQFLEIAPLHDWKNNFTKLHKLNPRFFRAGSRNNPEKALSGDDAAIFWQQHGTWMQTLGYPSPPGGIEDAHGVHRSWISSKGRQFYNLSHRTYDAERQIEQLQPIVTESASQLNDLKQAIIAGSEREQNLQSELQRVNESTRKQLAGAIATARDRENQLQDEIRRAGEASVSQVADLSSQLKAAIEEGRQRSIVLEMQLNEAHAVAARREAEWTVERAALETEALTKLKEFDARIAEGRQLANQLVLNANESAAKLQSDLEVQKIITAHHAERLNEQNRKVFELENAVHSYSKSNLELGYHIKLLQSQLISERQAYVLAKQKADESARQQYLSQKQFANTLQRKNAVNKALAAAVQELNTRLRMLLTSKLLHLGWRIGLGRTPYWNDPAADELTDVIDQTHGADKTYLTSIDQFKTPVTNQLVDQPLESNAASRSETLSAPPPSEMETALAHLYEKGFRPDVVLDVGAAKGYWTLNAAYRWQQAEFFMIDPLLESEADLQQICLDPRFHYLRLAIGDEAGEITMQVASDPDSSSLLLSDNTDPAMHQIVSMRTLDQLLDAGQIKPPQLVKLDVQGFELKVLRGASKIFDHAEVFIIEANLFEFMPGCPRLHELIAFMAERHFYPFDFAGFLRRPFENDLGQTDVVFVSRRSPMVLSNRWLNETQPVAGSFPAPPPIGDGMVMSIIICTHNPRSEIFHRTLDAIDHQTISKERFEVIVVDNASRLPLEMASLTEGRTFTIKLINEPLAGLSRARCTGISHAAGELFIFVDDDNFLSPDYLERALDIAERESRIGLFGGIAEAELETPIPEWKRPVLAHLGVRNHGEYPITKFADRWGEWEPIGAGMVARRSIAERFVRMFNEIPQARLLGRAGANLLSGEDSLFARAAYRQGFACSYQPALKLTHFIKSSRLTWKYMSRVVEGHGRSYVLLHRALGKTVPALKTRTAVARLLYRLKDVGRAGLITGRWEIGYAKEFANPSVEINSAVSEEHQSVLLEPVSLSVVLCTRNPRRDLFERTLNSIDRQRIERSDFELVIVDNASDEPITLDNVKAGRSMQIRLINEPQVGHVFARSAGISAANGKLILFVDDDNFLDPDYISHSIRIANEDPCIGAFGGIANPEFEKQPSEWKFPLLKYLAVRDHGQLAITSFDNAWGPWEPIGAGMVVRREVASRFVKIIRDLPGAKALGRSERHLMSGDDALFSRIAHRMGLSTSYQPALRLTHYMKCGRFNIRYLAKLLSGHGRTYVLLNLIMETPVQMVGVWETLKLIRYRYEESGKTGLLLWCWDWGRAMECRKHRSDPRIEFTRDLSAVPVG